MTRALPFHSLGMLTLTAAFATTGCGAAYYGTAAGIIGTQKDTKKIRTTAPDAAVAAVEAPTMASLVVGTSLVTDARGRSGLPLQQVRFPPGVGESRSDRGARTTATLSDELFISIDGNSAQRITLDDSSTGSAVAADIQAKVRALTAPSGTPPEAYSRFTCTFDAATREYLLRSGAPGEASAVVINPTGSLPQTNPAAAPAAITAAALRLGTANGGLERSGAESIAWTIFNHGDDVLGVGTEVSIWLSRSKAVDNDSLLIRRESTTRAVEVATARRFTSVNKAPPATLLAVASSGEVLISPGQYFLIVGVAAAGDDILIDNVRSFVTPIQVNAPFGGMPTVNGAAPATTATLDFAPTAFEAPIAVVSGARTVCPLTLTNFGAPVAAPTSIGVDVVLGTDDTFRAPTAVSAPVTTPPTPIAGFIVNPVDIARQATLRVDTTGAGAGVTVATAGNTVTATLNPATTTVNDLLGALGNNTLVDVVWDQAGDPAADTLAALFTATGRTETTFDLQTSGRLIFRQDVTFPQTDDIQHLASFVLDVDLPSESRFVGLPQRFTAFARIRPPSGTPPQDTSNDVRRASNYTRVYATSTATFDNGVLLPTQRGTDFARLEPVTQRPVNTGSIIQGQQRVFRFEIPSTGITLNESQLLVVVRTTTFDPHLELLDSTGRPIARCDDSALGLGSLLYLPITANQNQLVLYLIVSNASIDDSNIGGSGAAFDLTISVNPRQPGDPSLTRAVSMEELFRARDFAVADDVAAGQDQNDKLIPFDLAQGKAELMFVLPGRARVRFRTSPVFNVSVTPIITRFNAGEVPTAVQFQAEVDSASLEVVYRPTSGTVATSHLLREGVYTITFNSLEGPDPRTFLLELEADYVPASVN